jgi:hypothetical protein
MYTNVGAAYTLECATHGCPHVINSHSSLNGIQLFQADYSHCLCISIEIGRHCLHLQAHTPCNLVQLQKQQHFLVL